MKRYQAAALLWAMSRAYSIVEAACTPTAITIQLQPYKIICSGVTTEFTSTRTIRDCETTPPDIITTVTGTCRATTSCTPVTVPPLAGCTHPCTTTITTFPPGSVGVPITTAPPPDSTITTEGICTATSSCTPVTNPPPSDCTHPCTTTITTYPPSSGSPTGTPTVTTTTPPDLTITTEGICTATSSCTPVTNPPPSDCTHPCTTTITTYPPSSGSLTVTPTVTTTPPPDLTITTEGICTATTSCLPVINPPPSGCTRPCTTTITTYPPSSSTPSSSSTPTPPPTTPTSTPESSSTTPSLTSTTPPGPTLSCDPFGYLIQNQTLYRVNITSGVTSEVRAQVGSTGAVNSMGYNPKDNYLYATAQNGSQSLLLQIAGDGSSVVIPSNIGETTTTYNVGDITADGYMWISSGGGPWAEIDLSDPDSSTYGQIINSGDSSESLRATGSNAVYDWVSLPAYPGSLYALSSATAANQNTQLLAWSTSTHEWSVIKDYGVIEGAGTIGAAYPTNNGVFYAMGNESGDVFSVDVGNPDTEPSVVSTAPQSGLNDGARCQLASEV